MAAKPSTGMVKVRCPNPKCRKVLAVKAELGGKKGRCPICRQAMTIPALPEGKPEPRVVEAGAPPTPDSTTGDTVRLERADVKKGVGVGEPRAGPHPTPRTLRRIAEDATEAAYDLSGNVLRVTGPIGYDLNPVFRAKCDELLEVPDDEIIIDLVPVLYISSSHLGVLAHVMTAAEQAGKKITVRASLKASRVIRLAGLDRMCTLEVT